MKKAICTLIIIFLLLNFLSAQETYQKLLKRDFGITCSAIISTKDSGFAMAGTVSDSTVPYNFFISKFDKKGDIQWQKVLSRGQNSTAKSIIQTSDNCYIIAGTSNDTGAFAYSNFCVAKLDSVGNLLWSKIIGGNRVDDAYSIIETIDSSYVLAGSTGSFPSFDFYDHMYIVKIGRQGNVLWGRIIGSYEHVDWAESISQLSDGNYIIGGETNSSSQLNYANIIKLDSTGHIIWAKALYTSYASRSISAIVDVKDGFIAVGHGTNNEDGEDISFFVLKFDYAGKTIWSKNIPVNSSGTRNIVRTKDSGFIMSSGIIEPRGGMIVKLDKNWEIQWIKNLDEYVLQAEYVAELPDSSIISFQNLDTNHLYDRNVLISKLSASGYLCGISSSIKSITRLNEHGSNRSSIESSGFNEKDASFVLYPGVAGLTTTCTSDVLSLQLLSFTANRNGNVNILKWSVSKEVNTAYFEIERSSNSRDFFSIGRVTLFNNLIARNYSFTDIKPLKSDNYYRLKIIDKDGKNTYSNVQSISGNYTYDFNIYPNPVKQNIVLHCSCTKNANVQLRIVNAFGRTMLIKEIQLTAGLSVQTINASSFSKGYYFLQVISEEEVRLIKFVKE
ncbi:MAG TPA: T9SS type A sorting domain-containing protein [Panacibacter sp.]|nr:T9SS type A sorting domain-containing protein [Panacibacter sp.]